MTEGIQCFLIICEDFRMEEGEKPMIIGILSPVFHTSANPGVSDKVYVVTALTIEDDVEHVELKLQVDLTQPDGTSQNGSFRQSMSRPEASEKGQPWVAYLPLPVVIPEWQEGTRLTARLQANKQEANISLLAHLD